VDVPVLVITGAVGVGKTTVSYEVRLQLRDAGVSCVLIDDEFALFHPRPTEDPTGRQTSTRVLASLWNVYRQVGLGRLVLASVLESSADLDRIREAVPGADIQVFLRPIARAAPLLWVQHQALEGPSKKSQPEATRVATL
jgi:hypothetical protein